MNENNPQFDLTCKVKGNHSRRMSWNFRIGIKRQSSEIFMNTYILELERSHSIWQKTCFSIFKNSIFKYNFHIPMSFKEDPPFTVYQNLSYGKKIPMELLNRKIFLVFAGGIRWEWIYRYDRNLNEFEKSPAGNIVWLFQPNIEF